MLWGKNKAQLASAILETTREAGEQCWKQHWYLQNPNPLAATSSMGRVCLKESPRATFVKNDVLMSI